MGGFHGIIRLMELEALKTVSWRIGWTNFGGPAAQIEQLKREFVDERKVIDEASFKTALGFCSLLPGPEAQQLATWIGWKLQGTKGALWTGALFVVPSILVLWVLSLLMVLGSNFTLIQGAFWGLRAAVMAMIVSALIRLSRKMLDIPEAWAIAAIAFFGVRFFQIPFPIIIMIAAAAGAWQNKRFAPNAKENTSAIDPGQAKRSVKSLAIGLSIWIAPTLLFGLIFGSGSTLFSEGLFFSKAALVTFGGAYAVLPYVAQQAVEHYRWVSDAQMLNALGLAETTPGPLIMVLQVVAFIGAWARPDAMPPVIAATLASLLCVWATFVPCFVWVLSGGPYIERAKNIPKLAGALAAITAAVVGVLSSLAVWTAMKLEILALVLGVFAWFALEQKKWPLWKALSICVAAGIVRSFWF